MDEDRLIKAFTKLLDDRLGGVNSRLDSVDSRLDSVDSRLDKVDSRLDKVDSRLSDVDSRLDKVDSRLSDVDSRLDKVGDIIDQKITKALEPIKMTLSGHGEKLDILTAESHETNQLVRGVHDMVKARYDKNKREIDEVKKHLKIPLTPPFGD